MRASSTARSRAATQARSPNAHAPAKYRTFVMSVMRPNATPGATSPMPESSGARLVSNAACVTLQNSQMNIAMTMTMRLMRAARRLRPHAPIEYIAENSAMLLKSTSGTSLRMPRKYAIEITTVTVIGCVRRHTSGPETPSTMRAACHGTGGSSKKPAEA